MKYYLYHIPGKKIGVTRDLKERVERQQGYNEDEYQILAESKDITEISNLEIQMQKAFGYKVDLVPYNKLKFNKQQMEINITDQTTTFPCPVNKLKGQLMDNIGMHWNTSDGDVVITTESIKWIMSSVKTSMFNDQRSYIYNKAFVRYFDNNNAYTRDKVVTRTGGLAPTGPRTMDMYSPESKYPHQQTCGCNKFDLIREWAEERGLYNNGDTKTQALKLVEEVGETCRAILKEDHDEVVDGIGDCVVVLTNLAELQGVTIEECIDAAYDEIKSRKGKMVNGTFKKD